MTTLDWLISVDDHLIEPPDLWVSRASAAERDRVPKVSRENGIDTWRYEDTVSRLQGFIACAGMEPGTFTPDPINYDDPIMRPGYTSSLERIHDMDADHVMASLCFPTVPRLVGQMFQGAKDRQLSLRCIQMWNDFQVEEWAAPAPGRFIPLMLLPMWDPFDAAVEIERCAAMGTKAICFSENPHALGFPSIHDESGYWDPVLRAANDAGLPLTIHFGSSSAVPTTSPDAPLMVSATLVPMNLAYCMTDWLWSGQLQKYPDLKICLAEGGIGWIPYILERAQNIQRMYLYAKENDFRIDMMTGELTKREMKLDMDTPIRQLYDDHIFGCFIDDRFGSEHLEACGVDNVMIETDYPHSDGTWPRSLANARERLTDCTDEVVYKVTQGNARRVFRLETEIYRTPESATEVSA